MVDLFNTYMPQEFLKELPGGVERAYGKATDLCVDLSEKSAKNLLPYCRWVFLDDELAKLAEKYQDSGISYEYKQCDGGTNYVQVNAGKVVLTASYVKDPGSVPRQAVFRKTLARDNGPWLFSDMEEEVSDDIPLYAILIHAPKYGNPRIPEFVNIRFPLENCKRWAPGKIDLLSMFPTLTVAKDSFLEETIEDNALPELRDDAHKYAEKNESKGL